MVGKKNIKFGLKFDITEDGYWPNLYSFNNNETFSLPKILKICYNIFKYDFYVPNDGKLRKYNKES